RGCSRSLSDFDHLIADTNPVGCVVLATISTYLDERAGGTVARDIAARIRELHRAEPAELPGGRLGRADSRTSTSSAPERRMKMRRARGGSQTSTPKRFCDVASIVSLAVFTIPERISRAPSTSRLGNDSRGPIATVVSVL